MKSSVIKTLLLQVGVVFLFSTLLIGYLWVSNEFANLEQENQRVREQFLNTQKSVLSSEVRKIKTFLLSEKAKSEKLVKDSVQTRTEEAHAIATSLYYAYRDTLNDNEIQKIILEALRSIRFNDGRGYYFITSLNGIEHLFPPKPEFEGKHATEIFSEKGVKVVDDMIEIVKRQREGFYQYTWPKPNDQSKGYLKFSFVKLFEPYGWIIGTGDYLSDVETQVREEIFKKIAKVKYGMNDEGYFFINSYSGDLYVTNGQYFGGEKNIWEATDVNGVKVVQENVRIAKNNPNGGFSHYVWRKPDGTDGKKISFIEGMDEWNIFIGTGAYVDTIEAELSRRRGALEERLTQRLITALGVLIAAMIMVTLVMYFITKKLALNFSVFQKTFDMAAHNRVRIDVDRVFFSEFRGLAASTNQMIDTLNNQAERLRHQAHHDHLTALPNRVKGAEYLNQMIAYAETDGTLLALLFIDIDDFKEINDTLGHSVGDKLLQSVSDRLMSAIREEDAVARLGGDEFTVITGRLNHQQDAGAIAQKLLHTLEVPFDIENYQLHITASIGICLYPDDGNDAETMLRNADSAMYQAKRDGKNNYKFYNHKMTTQATKRAELLDDLRIAIKEEQFTLFYQPQIDALKNRVVGVEALVRWHHPVKGLITPDDFIPFSETSGQILDIGEWVLRKACQRMAAWRSLGYQLDYIAVNISGKQLQRQQLSQLIQEALDEAQLSPEFLELEVTESVVMETPSSTIADLRRLKDLGVGLSVDDFGTGYSSLSYLKQLPIDKLKIDRSFVRDLDVDENDRAIVKAIIALAHSLNLTVLAEGVENRAQLEILKQEICYRIQGYHFCRPLPEHELLHFLDEF